MPRNEPFFSLISFFSLFDAEEIKQKKKTKKKKKYNMPKIQKLPNKKWQWRSNVEEKKHPYDTKFFLFSFPFSLFPFPFFIYFFRRGEGKCLPKLQSLL